jgi:hypothetical protein
MDLVNTGRPNGSVFRNSSSPIALQMSLVTIILLSPVLVSTCYLANAWPGFQVKSHADTALGVGLLARSELAALGPERLLRFRRWRRLALI